MPFLVVEHRSFGPIIDITQVEDPWAEFLQVTLATGERIFFEIQGPTLMKFMRTPNDILQIAFDQSDVSVFADIVNFLDLGGTIVDNEKFLAEMLGEQGPLNPLSKVVAMIYPGPPKKAEHLVFSPVVGFPLTVRVRRPLAITQPLLGQQLFADFTFASPVAAIESIVLEEYGETRRSDPEDEHTKAHLEVQRTHEEQQSGK